MAVKNGYTEIAEVMRTAGGNKEQKSGVKPFLMHDN
ncbi:hypothetical protein [Endozoicomonas sp. ONNA2]